MGFMHVRGQDPETLDPITGERMSNSANVTHRTGWFSSWFQADKPGPKRHAGPSIAFVDNTIRGSNGEVDIDQDGVSDIPHGVLAALYLRRSKANIQFLNSDVKPGTSIRNNFDAIRAGCEGRINAFETLHRQIQSGKRLDAVNFSCATAGTTLNELSQVTGLPLTADNARQHEEAIRHRLFELADRVPASGLNVNGLSEQEYRFAYFGKVIRSMEKLTQRGVPVTLAAGNEGPGHINIYSLARGTSTVAAVNARGEKTAYSADAPLNPFIDAFARGDYNVVPVVKSGKVIGYDVTGSGKVDIPAYLVSGRGKFVHPVLKKFAQRRLQDFLLSPEELLQVSQAGIANATGVQNRLITVEDYGRLKGLSPEIIQKMKSQGEYTTLDGGWTFRVNPQSGRLYYDPDGSGHAGAVGIVRGSSWSAPTYLEANAAKGSRFSAAV